MTFNIIDYKIVNKIIDKIKYKFLLKKFKNSISTSKFLSEIENICIQKYSVFMSETEEINERFDDISKYITKKNVIIETNIILNNYYRWNKIDNINFIKIDARQLLCAWIINYCPSIILGEIDSDDKKFLLYFSRELIEQINIIKYNKDNDMTLFNKIFLRYTNFLIIFLDKDKVDKINYYTAEWISLNKSYELIQNSNKYTLEQKDIILKNIEKDKKLVEKYINNLSKNFDYNRLKLIMNISNNITKKIIDNYKQIIHDDIINKKYDISIKILNDIKKFILLFNRKINEIEKINDTIDGEYFIQLIKNNIIDINDVKLFGDYLFEYVSAIGSVSCEIDNKIKWTEIKKKYESKNDMVHLIADMMIFILDIIDIIRNEILDYDFLLQHIYSK